MTSSLFFGSSFGIAAGLYFTALLIWACATDIRSRRIPNWLVAALAAGGVVYSIVLDPSLGGLGRSLLGVVLGFSLWILFYIWGIMGAGDVKLFAAAGAWLGPAGAWRAALVAALIGGVLSVAFLVRERRAREGFTRVALSLAVLSPAPLGDPASESTSRSKQLPYGVAMALGALAVAWFPQLAF